MTNKTRELREALNPNVKFLAYMVASINILIALADLWSYFTGPAPIVPPITHFSRI